MRTMPATPLPVFSSSRRRRTLIVSRSFSGSAWRKSARPKTSAEVAVRKMVRMGGASLLARLESCQRRAQEEDTGTAGLFGVVVVEDRAERVLVDLHAARAGPPADGPPRIVELDRVVEVPAL